MRIYQRITKSMVGYSKCIDLHSDSIIAYTNNISSLVIHILELITKMLHTLKNLILIVILIMKYCSKFLYSQ